MLLSFNYINYITLKFDLCFFFFFFKTNSMYYHILLKKVLGRTKTRSSRPQQPKPDKSDFKQQSQQYRDNNELLFTFKHN
jgi:hypothetical protein